MKSVMVGALFAFGGLGCNSSKTGMGAERWSVVIS
jgi:hypothetical protein